MVSNGHGGHAIFLGTINQVADPDRAIQQAVLSMDMQMNEIGVLHQRKTCYLNESCLQDSGEKPGSKLKNNQDD
jgi:hypothetical protein